MAKKTTKAITSKSVATSGDGKTFAIQPQDKAANLLQLRRIKGQVEGIQRMVEEERYCADIIIQVTAARASLQTVAKSLLNSHLKACHLAASSNGGGAVDQMYQELVDLVSKMAR